LDATVSIKPYFALALQTRCDAINEAPDRAAARLLMHASISRISLEIAASKAFIGSDVRLVVLPEYCLTGFPMGESIAVWREKACLSEQDAVFDTLGEIAAKNSVFLAFNAYEIDPHFPKLYFQSSFVIDDQGAICLRYRRLISMYAPTPHDVWQRYLEIYGMDAVFPVADTEIGRLAAIASEEILYPEIARALAFRGAEVFLHCTSEVGSPNATPKSIAKRARAIENLAYVVSANSAGITGTAIPSQSTDGMSTVIDFKGNILIEAGFGESMVANAAIDLRALRDWRQRPGMSNLLSRQRTELFATTYAGTQIYPSNTLLDAEPSRAHFLDVQKTTIANLLAKGIIQ